MTDTSRPSTRFARLPLLSRLPILLIVLAITTGWGPLAPSTTLSAIAGRGHVADDSALVRSAATAEPFIPGQQDPVARPEHRPVAPTTTATSTPIKTKHVATTVTSKYVGQNYFWFPSLHISQAVHYYACGRQTALANVMYRWGCAGTNNVYIMGHAYGVMKPLHDAYVSGRLHVGMIAVYADAYGHVRTYRVTQWQVVRPTVVAWATASQPVPSMTLQTCIGATSAWRLDVRLVTVN